MASPPPRRGPRDDDLRHPRPGGGDGGRRADRGHERGPGRADRAAQRPLRASEDRVRDGLRRARSTGAERCSSAPTTWSCSQVPAPEAEEAMIERIVQLGFETRVELLLADGEEIWAQMTRDEAELTELAEGQIVYARPRRAKVFERERRAARPRSCRRPERPGQRGVCQTRPRVGWRCLRTRSGSSPLATSARVTDSRTRGCWRAGRSRPAAGLQRRRRSELVGRLAANGRQRPVDARMMSARAISSAGLASQ